MSSKNCASLIIFGTILFTFIESFSCSAIAPLCEPGIFEEMPVHIKKVCIALENSDQLSNTLRTYIKNEAAALISKSDDFLSRNYGKRTDVDHVFLRFGKKR